MKNLILTSDTNHCHMTGSELIPNAIDNMNQLIDHIKQLTDESNTLLYIASNPSDQEAVDKYALLLQRGLQLSGITFSNYLILDDRTKIHAAQYVKESNVIFLSGGDTYIENEFFKQIHLRELLIPFSGTIIGQSAGSINMADFVYNCPEEIESKHIYYEGLGLSTINVVPHFIFDTKEFDEMQMMQREHQLRESKKRSIYALCEGAHIIEMNNTITVYGTAYIIECGSIKQICQDKQRFVIK